MSHLDDTQQVFMLFFAILWGTVANVQPRWKAFQWPLFSYRPARNRVMLSVALLNVLPLCYFALALHWLTASSAQTAGLTVITTVRFIAHSVIPAFATFGFYRLWIACVELWPDAFFTPYKNPSLVPSKYLHVEPVYGAPAGTSGPNVDLNPVTGKRNAIVASVYIVVSVVALLIL